MASWALSCVFGSARPIGGVLRWDSGSATP